MKTRGTRGGIIISLEGQDTAASLEAGLKEQQHVLGGTVFLEISGRVAWPVVEAAQRLVAEAGGKVAEVRPVTMTSAPVGETVIVSKTVRSGTRIEATGSAIIIGDVNAGAEVVANGDIVVLGLLRGLAHAGVSGNEHAIIWAQGILSPQLRIAGFLAQAGSEDEAARGPEIASVVEGQIVLRPWGR
ncbi:MAG: septum site-determining protein MinC [Deinococcota bacterium]|nr:septum site-determining protein MinC [Deinococcota bacterium]